MADAPLAVAPMRAVWIEAARPKTLPAAVAPVLVGVAAAERFIAWRAITALVVALSLQVAVNFANDYFDGVKGVDTEERLGPRRVMAAGLVSGRQMKLAIAAALGVAAIGGLALAAAAGWQLLLVGAAAGLATLGYSGGPKPYASLALGEVFVFVFFGLVATAGTQYVLDETLSASAVWGGVTIGLLAVALLVVNNLRDIPTDREVGKRTLAVVLGERRTRLLYDVLVVGAFAAVVPIALIEGSTGPLLALGVLPLGIQVMSLVHRAQDAMALIITLGATARVQLLVAVLLAIGLLL